MAQIFFSWSSPDAALVLPLRDRLRDAGVSLWEYSEDMAPGDYIHGSVIEAINRADIAVICFSDATAGRDWVVRESEWSFKTRADGDKPLRHIVPVWVGPHPDNKVPPILAENQIRTTDLHGADDRALGRFISELCALLGRKAPRVVPAALFAMTSAQCADLLAAPDLLAQVGALCADVGLHDPAQVAAILRARYGPRPQDLAPFQAGQPLVGTIGQTLRLVNQWRAAEGKRPIYLRWMHDELFGEVRSQEARDLWAADDSLLVVDSVSAFHPAVQAQMQRLPQSRMSDRSALLWLPPYTQHTSRLEATLRHVASEVAQLGDAFSAWCGEPSARALTFDTTTPTGARLWLHRTLAAIDDRHMPLQQNLAAMQGMAQATIRPSDMYARTAPGDRP